LLDFGDVIIDGGNSFYKDSMRRANSLQKKGISFLDVGTSGGLLGAEQGASLTIGGPKDAYERVKPLFNTIARPNGHLYCGPSGAGHFVKMIHNGIEYAMLQSIGEGFEMLRYSQFDLNLEEIAKVWNNGCVIRSWLMEITAKVFNENPRLYNIKGEIGGGETGRWMIETALEKEISTPIIALSLLMRYRSRQQDTFAGKIVAALRNEFGGHSLKRI
jgi:6-phosphogluconate dehydrogenase